MSVSKHRILTPATCVTCTTKEPTDAWEAAGWSPRVGGYECPSCRSTRIAQLIGGRIPPAPAGGIVTRIRRAGNRAPQLGEGFIAGLALGGLVWAVIGAVAHGVPSW